MGKYRNFHDMSDLWKHIRAAHPQIPGYWQGVPMPAARLKTIVLNLRRARP